MHAILIISFLLGAILICFLFKTEKAQKNISIWGGIVLFFYGALRSTAVGIDVPTYVNTYLTLPYISFREIFTSETIISRDPFFYAFMKILSHINNDPQLMLVVISAIVAICVSILIYRNSVNPILSFIMFIGLRYYSFTLSGLRQAIAWSIIMLSYEFLKEKKLLKFVLTVFLASLFHRSAILFILAYPIANIRSIKKMSLAILSALFFNFITNDLIIRLFVEFSILQQYKSYIYSGETTTSGITMLLIYLCIIVFAFIIRKYIFNKYENAYLMYNLSLTGVAVTTLAFNYANIFRIGYYFIFPIILLFPCAIKSSLDRGAQLLLNFLVIGLLVVQFIIIGPGAGTDYYSFFWI